MVGLLNILHYIAECFNNPLAGCKTKFDDGLIIYYIFSLPVESPKLHNSSSSRIAVY